MNDSENDKKIKSESSEKKDKDKKRSSKQARRTQGQIIQEILGLGPTDIQDVEKKLFIARFLDYFSEETLDFIFKDSTINQYVKQITTHIENFGINREEDRLVKQSFESKGIIEIINKLKAKAEELAQSKGVKGSMDKRLRKLTLIITLPLFGVIFLLAFLPIDIFYLFPVLCIFCMLPQLIKGSVVKKWFAFKEQYKNEIYAENREDVLILKNFTSELLDNIRSRLLELKVPLQLIKFMLYSRDYENLTLLNQKNIKGTMQYVYTFDYPPGVEPIPVPQQLQQYQQAAVGRMKGEKMEINFIVLTNMQGADGIITSFVPTLKDKLAEKINDMLNSSEFSKASDDLNKIIPNYSDQMGIYCVCGEVAEISNIQTCNWKNQFKYYLFEGEACKCGEKIYALSLMDEFTEIPEELREIFMS
jgi:hypothetical protein